MDIKNNDDDDGGDGDDDEKISNYVKDSSIATIFRPGQAPRKQLVWAPGQGVTATTSSWVGPFGPHQPHGPPWLRGMRGPCFAPG